MQARASHTGSFTCTSKQTATQLTLYGSSSSIASISAMSRRVPTSVWGQQRAGERQQTASGAIGGWSATEGAHRSAASSCNSSSNSRHAGPQRGLAGFLGIFRHIFGVTTGRNGAAVAMLCLSVAASLPAPEQDSAAHLVHPASACALDCKASRWHQRRPSSGPSPAACLPFSASKGSSEPSWLGAKRLSGLYGGDEAACALLKIA